MQRRKAFTLIELLVVIAVIAVLMGILLPSLNLAREQGKKAVCSSHSRQLGLCFRLYADDNKGFLHQVSNNGLWDNAWEDPVIVKKYTWDDKSGYAYWGIAYEPYAKTRDIFHCPSQRRVDDWPSYGWGYAYQGFFKYCGYGLNGYVTWNEDKNRECNLYSDFKRPDEVILFQDHVEQKLDDNGDMFYIRSGESINLTQWRNQWGKEFPDAVRECFRHNKRSVTCWADGHVSEIRETTGEDVPKRWYTGKKESNL